MSLFDTHHLGGISRLLADLAIAGTSLTVSAGGGGQFRNPASYGSYNVTIVKADANGNPQLPVFTGSSKNAERVRVGGLASDVLSTLTRAQESTTAQAFVAGDYVYAAYGPLDLTNIEDVLTGTQAMSVTGTVTANPNSGAQWHFQRRAGTPLTQIVGFDLGFLVADKIDETTNFDTTMGISGVVEANNTSGTFYGVGVSGWGIASQNNTNVYGANFVVVNNNVNANIMQGIEVDVLGYPGKTETTARGIGLYKGTGANGTAVYIASLISLAEGTWNLGIEISGIGAAGVAIEVDPNISITTGIDMSGTTFSGYSLKGQDALFKHRSTHTRFLIDSPGAALNSQLIFAINGTEKWVIYGDGAGGAGRLTWWDDTGGYAAMQLLPGAPGANLTPLALVEGAGPSLRQVGWKAGNALGAGDKVMVMV